MTTTATATKTALPSKIQLKNDCPPNDISQLPPAEALRLLSITLESLVKITGDIPPTPPPRTPTDPSMKDLQAEKDIIAMATSTAVTPPASLPTPSPSLAASSPAVTPHSDREENQGGSGDGNVEPTPVSGGKSDLQAYRASVAAQIKSAQQQIIDGVRLRNEPITPPETNADAPVIVVVGAGSQPVNTQHGAITRKFYSKVEPPITITQYLSRLHQFCPMSTAVYLATSLYIHRLAVEQRAIPITRRNVHRLVLAGLRVATKALEDLAYPHAKVARVGGVSEAELARLEISFCFLAGFELVIGHEGLTKHWESLRDGRSHVQEKSLELRLRRPPRNIIKPQEVAAT